jgi:hypothetical protein
VLLINALRACDARGLGSTTENAVLVDHSTDTLI